MASLWPPDGLYALRCARHFTSQDQIARRVGISVVSYALIEQGRRNPSPRTLTTLARVLKLTPQALTQLLRGVRDG